MITQKLFSGLLALYVVLGCWKGYVALFEPGEEEPRQIFPTQVVTLPQTDQEALEAGIPVRNQRDLEQLLEDYLS
nr:BofC C-terminal domain-containing protein [Oscillospiraceae bacterium]